MYNLIYFHCLGASLSSWTPNVSFVQTNLGIAANSRTNQTSLGGSHEDRPRNPIASVGPSTSMNSGVPDSSPVTALVVCKKRIGPHKAPWEAKRQRKREAEPKKMCHTRSETETVRFSCSHPSLDITEDDSVGVLLEGDTEVWRSETEDSDNA